MTDTNTILAELLVEDSSNSNTASAGKWKPSNCMLKRLLDSAFRAQQYWSQSRERILRALAHNVMIL